MNARRFLLLALLVFVMLAAPVLAEVPPLSKKELDAGATLLVIGVVTGVKVSEPEARSDGRLYRYDLTVLVREVKKGNIEAGASLVARGLYIQLKAGYVGSMGHRADNTSERMPAIEPGWELALHLCEAKDGIHMIYGPNGFSVLARPPREESTWSWVVGFGVIAAFVLLSIFLLKGRLGNRPVPAA